MKYNYYQQSALRIKLIIIVTIFFVLEIFLKTYAFSSPTINKKNEFYPGDALEITFIDIYKKSNGKGINIGGQYIVDSRGHIMMPLVGSIKVVGYNRYTLAEKIVDVYKSYFTEPYISIKPLIRLTLMGTFKKPGSYRISPESSLWELIEQAGGPLSNCDLNSIKVIRGDKVVIEDLLASFEKAYSLEDIEVKSGDQIIAGVRKRISVRQIFDYVRFGMSIVSLYFLIIRWQQYNK